MTLRAADLWSRYGRRGPWVLAGASLELQPGEVVGLPGPSGCGKSTLGRVLAGLHPAERGLVDPGAGPTPSGANPVQVVLQHAQAAMDPRWTIRAVLAEAGADRATFDAIAPALVEPAWHDRHPHELSGGELQRVNLARALLARPRHLIADEITASLDPLTQAAIWRFTLDHCRRHGIGLLVISHDEPLLAAICDRTIPFAELARAGAQPERSSARNEATVSASEGALSRRYRLTRAKRRATPPA